MTGHSRDKLTQWIDAFIRRGYSDAEIVRELCRVTTVVALGFAPRDAELLAVIRQLLKKQTAHIRRRRPSINVPSRVARTTENQEEGTNDQKDSQLAEAGREADSRDSQFEPADNPDDPDLPHRES